MPLRGPLRFFWHSLLCTHREIKSATQFWEKVLHTRCRWDTLKGALLKKGCGFKCPCDSCVPQKQPLDCFQHRICNITSDHPSLKGIGKMWGAGSTITQRDGSGVNQGGGNISSRPGKEPHTTRMRRTRQQRAWHNLFCQSWHWWYW